MRRTNQFFLSLIKTDHTMKGAKWHTHLAALEDQVTWSSCAKTYLIRCLEKLIVAQSGCCDVLAVAREVRDACIYSHTYHRTKIPRVQEILRDSRKLIRMIHRQRRVIAMCSAASSVKAATFAPLVVAKRTIKPPHDTRQSVQVVINTLP